MPPGSHLPGSQVYSSVWARWPGKRSNHEADVPSQANADIGLFLNRLQNTTGLDVTAELAKLQATLQKDFDAATP
jgi:hypothetical protein